MGGVVNDKKTEYLYRYAADIGLLTAMRLDLGDTVEADYTEERQENRKPYPVCHFCGGDQPGMYQFNGRIAVCPRCVKEFELNAENGDLIVVDNHGVDS